MILVSLLGLGHRRLQLSHSSWGIINAIDEFHDIFLFIEVYTSLSKAEQISTNIIQNAGRAMTPTYLRATKYAAGA